MLGAGPTASIRTKNDSNHGVERSDDYAWLRADNWREVMRDPSTLAADIRAHLEAENAYQASVMTPTAELQETLFVEMKGRIKEVDASVPSLYGPWAYFNNFEAGGQYPKYCREPRGGGEAHTLLDGDDMAKGCAYFRFGGIYISPDHARIAYGVDTNGSEYYRLRFRDVASGADMPDEIADAGGDACWSACGQYLFYSRLDENHRPLKIFRHKLGSPAGDDALVYEEPDSGFTAHLGMTQSREFIIIQCGDHETSEVRVIPAAAPFDTPRLIAPRVVGHEYEIEHQGGEFIILTNADGAEDFKIVSAPIDAPGRENWREIESHRPGRLILDVSAFRDYLVRLEREDGLPRIVIRRMSDGAEHEIAFAEEAYSLGMQSGFEFDTTGMRFTYSSMTTPSQTYDYDLETRERTLRKTQEVPSGHEPADYITRRIFAPAHDGESVPISLLYRKSTPLDGSAPLLLYGYGSYGIAMPAHFSTGILSLVDRGFVYAIAHIRGGKDKGYRWYLDGKREKKQNTFKDFVAAGEYLAREGFTSRGRIVAQGGSAGGMLMGAVANMAPDLFNGIIAEVPFVDVLTTMLDDTLPLTPPEWPEWGNPIASAQDYATIAAYSPYDNVRGQNYPHILAVAGLTDPRVTYWEPAKWVAKLRANKTNGNILMLKTIMEAGHSGASGRFDRLKDVALVQAFAVMISGKQ
ncbi:MAG: S9 family peptidase [Hyphomicrobiales bacterium]|nr:S9 family peptidase [Hyphomicrobiales bacterium]